MRALALDVGLKRIGVALCIDKKIALPLDAVLRKNRNQAANEIKIYLKYMRFLYSLLAFLRVDQVKKK